MDRRGSSTRSGVRCSDGPLTLWQPAIRKATPRTNRRIGLTPLQAGRGNPFPLSTMRNLAARRQGKIVLAGQLLGHAADTTVKVAAILPARRPRCVATV